MIRLCAVLGADVSRSLSPRLHAAAARALGVELAYVPISTSRFDAAIDALLELGALGANVTQPYKTSALARATSASPVAREIGAANTLRFGPDRRVDADNTDGPALVDLLSRYPREALLAPVILGAGGAARAVVWALARVGAARPTVVARSPDGVELPGARVVGPSRPAGSLVVSAVPAAAAAEVLSSWVDAPMLLDLAYGSPAATSPLVALARARGIRADDGLELLLEQAARSFSIWTGRELDRVREAMRGGL